MAELWKPLPFGQVGQDKTTRQAILPISLSQHASLADFCQDGIWFTAALPLTSFRIPTDPLPDFLARRPDDGVRIYVTNQRKLFSGIANDAMKHWDYAVFWCPKPSWDAISSHLANCVFQDGKLLTYTEWLVGSMPDVPALTRSVAGEPPPRVPVAVLSLKNTEWYHNLLVPEEAWPPLIVQRCRESSNANRPLST